MTNKTEWEAKLERVKLAAYRSGVEFGEAERDALREALSGALKLLRQLERLHDDIIITGDIEHFSKALAISEKSE